MHHLIEFSERRDFRELVGRVTEFKSVQGVILNYDPLWLELWRVKCTYGDRAVERFISSIYDLPHFGSRFWPLAWDSLFPGGDLGVESSEIEPPNLRWIPPHWTELLRTRGMERFSNSPLIVKVCLLPWEPKEAVPDLGEYPFLVIRERRAPAVLTMPLRRHRPVIGGVSIGVGSTDSGTLGGIVKDQNNKQWGVTCAHVLNGSLNIDQPAQCDSGVSSAVGLGCYKAVLRASPGTTPCNPYASSTSLNIIDAALIEFSPGIMTNLQVLNHGDLSGIMRRTTPSPGQIVDMAGKQSGSRPLEIGGLAVTYRLRDSGGSLYCFKELFEVRWPRCWRVIGGRPVQHGDSGAWLLSSQATGTQWVGMALGGDRLIGYAMFAENIVDWASSNHNLNLRVM